MAGSNILVVQVCVPTMTKILTNRAVVLSTEQWRTVILEKDDEVAIQ